MDRRIKAGAIAILATTTVAIMCVDEASARSFRGGGGFHRSGGHHVRAPRMVHRQPRLTRPARTIQLRVPHRTHRTVVRMPTRRHAVASLAQAQRVKWHQIRQNQAALRAAATGRGRIYAQMGQMQPQIGQRPAPMPGLTNPVPPATKVVQLGPVTVALPARVRIPEVSIGIWDVPRVPSTVRTTTLLGGAVDASPAADTAERQAQADRKVQWQKEMFAAAQAEKEHRKVQWQKEIFAAAKAEAEHREKMKLIEIMIEMFKEAERQAQWDKAVAKANEDEQNRKQAQKANFQAEKKKNQEEAEQRRQQNQAAWGRHEEAMKEREKRQQESRDATRIEQLTNGGTISRGTAEALLKAEKQQQKDAGEAAKQASTLIGEGAAARKAAENPNEQKGLEATGN